MADLSLLPVLVRRWCFCADENWVVLADTWLKSEVQFVLVFLGWSSSRNGVSTTTSIKHFIGSCLWVSSSQNLHQTFCSSFPPWLKHRLEMQASRAQAESGEVGPGRPDHFEGPGGR